MNTADKLAEAIELAEDAMAYVPEYFAHKHGMLRRMAALKEVAAHEQARAALAQRRERLTDGQLSALLKEARKIIRASSSRSLAKDWDRRATQALAGATTGKEPGNV